MKRIWIICVGAVGVLSACDTATDAGSSVPYEPTAQIAPKSVSTFMFRTHSKTGGKTSELKGVPCEMTGDGFRSEFVTPAKVTAPVFGPETKPVSIECEYKDERRVRVLKPFNKTQANANKSLISLKSATSVTGAVIAAAKIGTAMAPRDRAEDEFAYRNADMAFGNTP